MDVRTPVLAALDGKVHSFKNNDNLGDYGPTIITGASIRKLYFLHAIWPLGS